jgi:hypothetical protein
MNAYQPGREDQGGNTAPLRGLMPRSDLRFRALDEASQLAAPVPERWKWRLPD